MSVIAWSGSSVSTEISKIDNHLEWSMLCEGTKTQVRTMKPLVHRVGMKNDKLVMLNHGTSFVPFVIQNAERKLLADLTIGDIEAEGFSDLTSFKEFWIMKNDTKHFSPHERVYVTTLFRFHPDDDRCVDAMRRLALQVYPLSVR